VHQARLGQRSASRSLAKNFLQQQEKFDDFIQEFNQERPHQALNMKYPTEFYTCSPP
jgi:transposase InsO family protein